ncbi:FkbM family methyltransferase [Flavobacteriaceae bacterium]|nr:FkbM family methyltransferase [Flavobacteriaceae bacterium]
MNLKLTIPNSLSKWRAETFFTKEVETLEWIDSFQKGTVFWDIGANVGLYSIYAGKKNNKVYSFEPSVFNLELLAKNIHLNNLSDLISIVPLPINDKSSWNKMRLSSDELAGALSSFDHKLDYNGNDFKSFFEYSLYGLSMDDLVNVFKIPKPDYIKIDVDGIEHFILKGGMNVLKECKGVLIEINDNFHDQADTCKKILNECGLKFLYKKNSSNKISDFSNTYNQIWKR